MASVTQPIASCCQMQAPMPPPPRTQCGLSSCSSKFMPGTELGKDQRAACSSGEHDANSRRSPGESPLPTKAIPTRGLPSLHLKRRGERAAGFGRHAQSSSSRHPEPIRTPLAAAGRARATWEGLRPDRHSGRRWLDHTHYVCVSVRWRRSAARVVDPVSKAPGRSAAPGEGHSYSCSEVAVEAGCHVVLSLDRAAAYPGHRIERTKPQPSEMALRGLENHLLPLTCWEDRPANWLAVSPVDWEVPAINCQSFLNQCAKVTFTKKRAGKS